MIHFILPILLFWLVSVGVLQPVPAGAMPPADSVPGSFPISSEDDLGVPSAQPWSVSHKTFNNCVEGYDALLAEKNADILQLRAELEKERTAKINAVKNCIKLFNIQQSDHSNEIDSFKKERSTLQEALKTRESELKTSDEALKNERQQHNKTKDQLQHITTNFNKISSDMTDMADALFDMQQERDDLLQDKIELQDHVEAQADEIQELEELLEIEQDAKGIVGEQYEEMVSRLDEEERQHEETKKLLASVREGKKMAMDERDDLASRLDNEVRGHHDTRDSFGTIMQALASATARAKEGEDDLEEAQERIRQLEDENDGLREAALCSPSTPDDFLPTPAGFSAVLGEARCFNQAVEGGTGLKLWVGGEQYPESRPFNYSHMLTIEDIGDLDLTIRPGMF